MPTRPVVNALRRFVEGAGFPHPDADIAVGCSGGADSMALTLALRDWRASGAGTPGRRLSALVVDHGLRAGSADSAARVLSRLRQAGVEAQLLTVRPPAAPQSNIQAWAREQRYALLLGWCRDNGVADLFLAHHLDDQAETFLLRLGRGSGVDGLSAMRPLEQREGIRLLRPLLQLPKQTLRHVVADAGMAVEEDPANSNPAFARARIRAMSSVLASEGLTPARLAATAGRMARAREALEQTVSALFDKAGQLLPAEGVVCLQVEELLAAPQEIALRLLARAVTVAAGRCYPPRFEQTQRLYNELSKNTRTGWTLSGCMAVSRRGVLWLGREPAAPRIRLLLDHAGRGVWDGRFDIHWCGRAVAGKQLYVAAAGDASGFGRRPEAARRPAFIYRAAPALWCGSQPVLSLIGDGTAAKKYGIEHISFRSDGLSAPAAFSTLFADTM